MPVMSRLFNAFPVNCIILFPFIVALACLEPAHAAAARASNARSVEHLVINARAQGRPFPHFWERMFGSGRAVLVLRADYQSDLTMMRSASDIGYVRFHGLLDRGVGLVESNAAPFYNRASMKRSRYNFSYVDQIYDALLAHGVRPFVELDFMPKALAADPHMRQSFWYRPIVSPPRSYAAWDSMIRALARHLISRYGIDEVAKWYFEVWNEPNLDFWGGVPKQPTYFTLYDHTARALKEVNARIRVGGPATAQAAWVSAFLAHVSAVKAPIDFVSTHVYANDTAENVFGIDKRIPRRAMVCRAVRKVHEEIARSAYPHLPLIFSEYNASYSNEPDVTDTPYMGPWLAGTIARCDGLVQMMSYWTFSDVFEEGGVIRKPFYGGFGLIAEDQIPKAAFNAFAILHKLGDVRLDPTARSALITRTPSGAVAIALWNYSPPDGTGPRYTPPPPTRQVRTFKITIRGISPSAPGELWRVDDRHSNVLQAFDAMGRPRWPTPAQIRELRTAGQLAPPRQVHLRGGRIEITVPQHGLFLLLLSRSRG
jgi:xylan 1,4-beta-xylosidase